MRKRRRSGNVPRMPPCSPDSAGSKPRPGPAPLLLEAPVRQACRAMRQRGTGAGLVGKPPGHFTGRNVVCRMLARVMTPRPPGLGPHARVPGALRLMRGHGCPNPPVTDGARLFGSVSHAAGLDRPEGETKPWQRP